MKNIVLFIIIIILLGMSTISFSQSQFRSGRFFHHSTGNRIWGPNGSSTSIPNEMILYNSQKGYTGNEAVSMNETWFPSDDNEWYTWHRIFDNSDPNDNIYPYIQNNKIIVIKSCYPSSEMIGVGSSGDTLTNPDNKTIYNYKWHWRSIIRIMEQHPENFFVIWTNAPLVPSATNSQQASLADQFCTWAKDTLAAGNDPIFGEFPSNVYVFDFFHKLADATGMLQLQYATSTTDSHPNGLATELVSPQFVQEIFNAALNYESAINSTSFQLAITIQSGWNMVSTPGLHPTNQNVLTWWSGKDPAAGVFRFSGGYLPVTTTTPGQGYWMKHSGAKTYNTGDEWPAGGIQIVAHTSLTGATGWNLIGGYETSVLTANITTTPPGLRTGQVFGYSGGYTPATNLVPGYGYWIKLTGAGQINIPNALSEGPSKIVETNTKDWGKIIIADNSGKSYTLYTVKGEANLNDYELPPSPPSGMFDVRYGSDRYAEILSSEVQSINMQGIEYPVKVRVENVEIRLQDEIGTGLNERLKSGEEVTIGNSSVSKLMVTGDVIPSTYSLEQNYPNPFNPSTKIRWRSPVGSWQTLKVYDILGNEVTTLVEEYRNAGFYEIEFQSALGNHQLANGVYFYRLQIKEHSLNSRYNFVETRKMLLLK